MCDEKEQRERGEIQKSKTRNLQNESEYFAIVKEIIGMVSEGFMSHLEVAPTVQR